MSLPRFKEFEFDGRDELILRFLMQASSGLGFNDPTIFTKILESGPDHSLPEAVVTSFPSLDTLVERDPPLSTLKKQIHIVNQLFAIHRDDKDPISFVKDLVEFMTEHLKSLSPLIQNELNLEIRRVTGLLDIIMKKQLAGKKITKEEIASLNTACDSLMKTFTLLAAPELSLFMIKRNQFNLVELGKLIQDAEKGLESKSTKKILSQFGVTRAEEEAANSKLARIMDKRREAKKSPGSDNSALNDLLKTEDKNESLGKAPKPQAKKAPSSSASSPPSQQSASSSPTAVVDDSLSRPPAPRARR